MGEVKVLNFFAAIPGRASMDENLTGLHFRTLMVIAGHDRMGRNGQCCWIGREKLAARVGCHPSSLSTSITDLISLGYLEVVKSESDGRKRGYRVIYDTNADAAGIGASPRKNRLRDGNLSHESRLRDGNLSLSEKPDKNVVFQSVTDNFPETQYIQYKQNIETRGRREPSLGSGTGGEFYGVNTHPELVERLGAGNTQQGWEHLMNLSDETRKWLEHRCSDGTLDADNILTALSEARRLRSNQSRSLNHG